MYDYDNYECLMQGLRVMTTANTGKLQNPKERLPDAVGEELSSGKVILTCAVLLQL